MKGNLFLVLLEYEMLKGRILSDFNDEIQKTSICLTPDANFYLRSPVLYCICI